VHGIAFAAGVLSITAALVVLSRRFAADGARGWARCSAAIAVTFVVLAGLGLAVGDFRITAVAMVLAWGFTALTAARLAIEASRLGGRHPQPTTVE